MKIPGTKAGLPAIEDMIAAGRSINVTLIFSLARHREVMEAYIRGARAARRRLAAIRRAVSSVASFFVSRVDTEADKRLDAIGGHEHLKGKLAVANAKLAYRQWQETFSGARWDALEAAGASKQWCLWASTSTKNPAYRDVLYVEELIGPRHGEHDARGDDRRLPGSRPGAAATLERRASTRRTRLLDELADGGDRLRRRHRATLEREGVEKFSDSFAEALDGIRAKQGALASA